MPTGLTFDVQPVNRPRQQVEAQLRAAITTGQLAQGQKLPSEAELAEMFGVSRATIREALRSLATSGLISKSAGATGGSFVRKIGVDELAERFQDSMQVMLAVGSADHEEVVAVREMLELPTVRLAAVHATPEDIENLLALIPSETDVDLEDPNIPLLDAQFHTALARASQNVILTALVGAFHGLTQPVRYMNLRTEESWPVTVRQHTDVVRAIEAGDPDAAEQRLREHLTYVAKQHMDEPDETTGGKARPRKAAAKPAVRTRK